MISFEIGNGNKEITSNFLKKLFDNGVIAFSAGKNPYRIRFLLPLSIKDEHIKEIMAIIEDAILQVFQDKI